MHWVLLIMYWTSTGQPVEIDHVDGFTSQVTCHAAEVEVHKFSTYVYTKCVKVE